MTVRLFCFWSMVAVELECDDDISKTDQLGETICLFSRQRDQILERVAVIDHVACLIRGRGEVPTQIRLQPTDYSTRLGPSCTTSGKSVDDSHHVSSYLETAVARTLRVRLWPAKKDIPHCYRKKCRGKASKGGRYYKDIQ
jgi:hypothetical protein